MSPESIACSAATASAVTATARSLSFRHSVVNLRPSSASPSVSPRLSFSISAMKRSPKRLKYSAKRIFKGDGMLYVEADPSGAENWKLDQVVELIKDGAVGVIPTDTVYAIVCDLKSHSAIEHLRSVKWPTKDEWILDPVLIADIYPEGLDFVVAGGIRVADPSTVVDMTGTYPTIIRQGKGPKLDWIMDKDENTMSEEKELVVGAP
ncbi:hypothetical protein QJS04_geneDACA012625 [Acorus gramineus]|uniref:Threonylcarbamoyl-AMP synthase n=1 Tax=Acorus gramineus TaxID=55184 RepID=A0AAV9B3Y0_ACOGR|nr:hypothetical protein QJS04_geneDACA012625 [Acorus gramineus]